MPERWPPGASRPPAPPGHRGGTTIADPHGMKPVASLRSPSGVSEARSRLDQAFALAEGVLNRVARSPEPSLVLDLVASPTPRRSYQRLAQRLHPDRASGVTDAERACLEEAFKLVKAAWEASAANPQRSPGAIAHFVAEHARLRSVRPAPRIEVPDDLGGPRPSPEAEAAAAAFRAAQASAAAAESATRDSRCAFARKSLEDYGSWLAAELRGLGRLAKVKLDPALAARAAALTRRAVSIPTAMTPPLDPRSREARRRLGDYEAETLGELRSLSASLADLRAELEAARSTQLVRSQRLAQARLSLSQALLALHNLRAAAGPEAELRAWEQRLGEYGALLKSLATALRGESDALAQLDRSVNRLTSALTMKASQVARDPTLAEGQAALRGTLDLSRAAFGRWTKEWEVRVGMASETIAPALADLESRMRASIAAARRQGLVDVSVALPGVLEREQARTRRYRAGISSDVVSALEPALRARLEAFVSDLDRLGAACVERERPSGGLETRATRVSGLSNPGLESAWNQAVEWAEGQREAREAERERRASEQAARARVLEARHAAAKLYSAR